MPGQRAPYTRKYANAQMHKHAGTQTHAIQAYPLKHSQVFTASMGPVQVTLVFACTQVAIYGAKTLVVSPGSMVMVKRCHHLYLGHGDSVKVRAVSPRCLGYLRARIIQPIPLRLRELSLSLPLSSFFRALATGSKQARIIPERLAPFFKHYRCTIVRNFADCVSEVELFGVAR